MIFNTFTYYFVYLFPAAILFRLASPSLRPWVCIVFGSLFFVFFSFTGALVGFLCLLMFLWECLVSRLYRPRSWICLFGIVQAVGILCVFKYWNFLTGLTCRCLGMSNHLYWAGAFLPLGVSFFTFEFIHYAADRYKNKTEAGNFAEYLCFILFFPTLVAGPIKRYQDFLPRLRAPSADWGKDWHRGLTRIFAGLLKKFGVADVMTSLTDHLNRADIGHAGRAVLLLWVFAYGIKIYFDFSAYSDIAIGSARLIGICVPENFDWPYLQTDIAAFWQHWHMSLYRWLIDYIFIPLGGSRVAIPLVYRNVLLTMMLSGLWHGAGLNFLAWGLWHGLLLSGHRLWVRLRPAPGPPTFFGTALSWLITYVSVNLGWAFFAMNFSTAIFFFERLFRGAP